MNFSIIFKEEIKATIRTTLKPKKQRERKNNGKTSFPYGKLFYCFRSTISVVWKVMWKFHACLFSWLQNIEWVEISCKTFSHQWRITFPGRRQFHSKFLYQVEFGSFKLTNISISSCEFHQFWKFGNIFRWEVFFILLKLTWEDFNSLNGKLKSQWKVNDIAHSFPSNILYKFIIKRNFMSRSLPFSYTGKSSSWNIIIASIGVEFWRGW